MMKEKEMVEPWKMICGEKRNSEEIRSKLWNELNRKEEKKTSL
jgi:hypothetical protein